MFYGVAMVASNMNGLLGEKDFDLEILLLFGLKSGPPDPPEISENKFMHMKN